MSGFDPYGSLHKTFLAEATIFFSNILVYMVHEYLIQHLQRMKLQTKKITN